MFNFQGLGSTQIQTTDIKVMSASKIKLGQPLMDFLELNPETSRVFIDKDVTSNKFWIAAIPVVTDPSDAKKVISAGKKISADGSFGNANINYALGGQYSEYSVSKSEGVESDGITYYPLTKTVDGATKRAELAVAAGVSELDAQKAEAELQIEEIKAVEVEETTERQE